MPTNPLGSPTPAASISAPASAATAPAGKPAAAKPRTGKKVVTKKSLAAKEASEAHKAQRKLFMRMAMAAALMLALLLALFVFDFLKTDKPEEPEPSVVAQTTPSEKKALPEDASPALPPAISITPIPVVEAEKTALHVAAPSASATEAALVPAKPAVPALPPPPEIAARPVLPRTDKAAPPVSPPSAPAKVTVSNAEAGLARPQVRVAEPTRTNLPPALQAPQVAQPQPPLSPARLMTGYAVQAGVFADVHRAEELHAKLVLAGIPATLETRVQIGPFKTQAEANAARARLEKMGVNAVLLPKAEKPRTRR